MKYRQLSQDERWQISALHTSGISKRSIAFQLNRSPSTISRELKRKYNSNSYSPTQRQKSYINSRQKSGAARRKLQGEFWRNIKSMLVQHWSPEQISGRMKLEGIETVSHTTIYRRLHAEKSPLIKNCLRHKGKKYRKSMKISAGRGLIPDRVDIDERPEIVDKKERLGDWEADTIIGAAQKGAIVSLVDKASKFTKLRALPNKKSTGVCAAIISALRPHKEKVLTITYDNGSEFAKHKKVDMALKSQGYFAHPYSSWERGLNEHTNGLVRQYFPKGSRLDKISPQKLSQVEKLLNNRPRKSLDYRTPSEVFYAV